MVYNSASVAQAGLEAVVYDRASVALEGQHFYILTTLLHSDTDTHMKLAAELWSIGRSIVGNAGGL